MRNTHILIASLLMLSFSAFAQVAPVPQWMNFQGRLATPSGNPVPNGTYSIRFSLWDTASAGTEKWNQTLSTVTVKNGTFAVLLNTNTANLFNGNLYLEIKIGNDAALTPRQQLVSMPYAFKADTVPDGSLTAAKLNSSFLTAGGDLIGTFPNPFLATLASSLTKVSGGSMTALTNGNIGIGTASPGTNRLLVVNNTTTDVTQTWYAPAKGNNQSHSHFGSNGDWYIRSAANAGKVVIQDNGGNVGIGTVNPQYALDVYGNINAASTIYGHGFATNFATIDFPGLYGDNPYGGTGIQGETGSDIKPAIYGHNSGHGVGVWGDSAFGFGLSGTSGTGYSGVYGSSTKNGVYGLTSSSDGNTSGVIGRNDGAGWGVFGYSSGTGYAGVFGSGRKNGVYGQTSSAVDSGVYGRNDGAGVGMEGYSVGGTGVNGKTSAAGGYGGYFTNFAGGTALWVNGTARVSVLEITGGADLAEKFAVEGKIEPGMVVEIDAEHEGRLRLSQSAFNRRVAGVISGAKKLNAGVILSDPSEKSKDDLPVAMSGRVWVWCDASEHAITPGDFLTTAARPGYAMPVFDLSKAQGAILGKAMTSLAKGKTGMVLALVNLQ